MFIILFQKDDMFKFPFYLSDKMIISINNIMRKTEIFLDFKENKTSKAGELQNYKKWKKNFLLDLWIHENGINPCKIKNVEKLFLICFYLPHQICQASIGKPRYRWQQTNNFNSNGIFPSKATPIWFTGCNLWLSLWIVIRIHTTITEN